jgi:hypothetical protein
MPPVIAEPISSDGTKESPEPPETLLEPRPGLSTGLKLFVVVGSLIAGAGLGGAFVYLYLLKNKKPEITAHKEEAHDAKEDD